MHRDARGLNRAAAAGLPCPASRATFPSRHRFPGPVGLGKFGHKTRSMFERYNIKNEDDLREAAAVVANEMGRNGQVRAKVTMLPATAKEKT